MRIPLLVLLLLGCGLAAPMQAQNFTFSGIAFGDYYWVAAHHRPDLEGRNGFWLRRLYLVADHRFDASWSVRLRGELNQPGDFATRATPPPYLKDAYVRWEDEAHEISLGLVPTPTMGLVEEVWGYRAVERTPLDLQKMGAARDLGVSVAGRLRGGGVRYHATVGNGGGLEGEVDRGKKIALAVGLSPRASLTFEAYGDYEGREGETDRYTVQGFVAYRGTRGRLGLQLARHTREVAGAAGVTMTVASVFGVLDVAQHTRTFVRYDRLFDPNPDGDRIAYLPFDPAAAAHLIVGGLDFRTCSDRVHFMPNVEVVFYDPVQGRSAGPDVVPRMTFSFEF